MTTTRTRWAPVATTTIFIAATSLGFAATAQAISRDEATQWFLSCVNNDHKNDPSKPMDDVNGSCCIRAGGTVVRNQDGSFWYCNIPYGPEDDSSTRPTPPKFAVPSPGLNTRAGIQ